MNLLLRISLTALLAGPLLADDALDLRLRSAAVVATRDVTLGDVLAFGAGCDELRTALAGDVIATAEADTPTVEVTYDQVHERLLEAGVNLGRVLLSGAARCSVRVTVAAEPVAPREAEPVAPGDDAPLFREVATRPARSDAPRTLAEHVVAYCQREWAEDGGEVEIDFERGREDLLGLTAPTFMFVIKAPGRTRLGLREFRVTLRRDGETVATESVFGRVRVARDVLVAVNPLNIGRHVEPDDVAAARRVFESESALGLTRAAAAVGQRLRVFVPEGEMVRRADLEPADLVKRSSPVSVYSNGSVGVRLQGTALENGGYGEVIRVRLGEARTSRRVVRGEVTGVGEVRLLEDSQ